MRKYPNDFFCLVAFVDNIPAGYVFILLRNTVDRLYKITNAESYLNRLFVVEKFRKLGLGSQLVNKINNELYSQGISEVYLAVKKTNIPAINLYNKLGFLKIGEKKFLRIRNMTIPHHNL